MSRGLLLAGALAVLAALAPACRPSDANLGGEWACPDSATDSCFLFDSALQEQMATKELAY